VDDPRSPAGDPADAHAAHDAHAMRGGSLPAHDDSLPVHGDSLPAHGDGLPLAGIVVADFTRVVAGPMATMALADLGATVIKVERPDGDDTRRWGPPWGPRSSSYFEAVNRTKLSVTLDLSDPDDRAAAVDLACRADVLVENFRTGTMARFGLDHETLQARNPRLVYCSLTGFGSRGGASLPGYDFIVQALGGLMSVTGDPAGDPVKVGVALVDVLTGKDAVIGILAALAARTRTGRGQRVEVNLLSSLLASMINQAGSYLTTGTPPARLGDRHPSIAPYETLACRDGRIAVACGNGGQFRRLVALLGLPDLADDPRFATNAARVAHRDALAVTLESRLATDDATAWQRRLIEADVPAGRVGTLADGFALAEQLGLSPTRQAGPGEVPQVAHPITYSGFTPRHPTPPPGLGEHDAAVRAWLQAPRGTHPLELHPLDMTRHPTASPGQES
jgi:crotonobetainyl-CoA:carnitine CoA-transferase CaiB-like acyl-CoA transferase